MSAPVHRLKKTDIIALAKHHCKRHNHTYLEHYQCFLEEQPNFEERIGYFDLECSNLKADFGIILCYCIKDSKTGKIDQDVITLSDIQSATPGSEDKRLIRSFVQAIRKYDRLVGFYSSRFDGPFVRTRALMTGVPFPHYGEVLHTDVYDIARSKICLSSRRLENCCRNLLGKTNKTRIENAFWRGGVRGDEKSLQYVLDHCQKDVIDLERLYLLIRDFAKVPATRTSL
jgi:uncharacterized protein YprB with RNaseH-like and TPR domain